MWRFDAGYKIRNGVATGLLGFREPDGEWRPNAKASEGVGPCRERATDVARGPEEPILEYRAVSARRCHLADEARESG